MLEKVKNKFKKESEFDILVDKISKKIIRTENVEELEKLTVMLEKLDGMRGKSKISPDTKAVVLTNLLGIVMILKHEQFNVISSKAFSLILRGRV